MPLYVSSTMCSSSGCQNCIVQHLVSSHKNCVVGVHGHLVLCCISNQSFCICVSQVHKPACCAQINSNSWCFCHFQNFAYVSLFQQQTTFTRLDDTFLQTEILIDIFVTFLSSSMQIPKYYLKLSQSVFHILSNSLVT